MKFNTDFQEIFFSPILINPPVDKNYQQNIRYYIESAKALSSMNGFSVYLLDYVEFRLIYSDFKELFLCGYSSEEVEQYGIDFFEKVLHSLDFGLFIKINEEVFNFFFNRIEPEDRKDYWAYCDLRTISKDRITEIHNFRFFPLIVDGKGNIVLCIVQVCLSPFQKSGRFLIFAEKEKKIFEYSEEKKQFVSNKIKFTLKEKRAISLMCQGYTAVRIMKMMSDTRSNVNYYIQNAYKKLGAKNAGEAIFLYPLMGDYL